MRDGTGDDTGTAPDTPDAATATPEPNQSPAARDDVARGIDDDGSPAPFPHPPWTVGLVLVAGVITLLFGILVNPVWLLVGSPFVLALFLWLYVRLFVSR